MRTTILYYSLRAGKFEILLSSGLVNFSFHLFSLKIILLLADIAACIRGKCKQRTLQFLTNPCFQPTWNGFKLILQWCLEFWKKYHQFIKLIFDSDLQDYWQRLVSLAHRPNELLFSLTQEQNLLALGNWTWVLPASCLLFVVHVPFIQDWWDVNQVAG